MQGNAAFPGLFCSCYMNVTRQTINLLYMSQERGRRRPRHTHTLYRGTDCEGVCGAVLGGPRPRLTGSCGHRDECARAAAACSGRSTIFHQTSPQSLHPLLFHIRRGKPANLSGKRRGELENGQLKGPPVLSPGLFPCHRGEQLCGAGCTAVMVVKLLPSWDGAIHCLRCTGCPQYIRDWGMKNLFPVLQSGDTIRSHQPAASPPGMLSLALAEPLRQQSST